MLDICTMKSGIINMYQVLLAQKVTSKKERLETMEREVVHVPQVVKLKKYNIYQRVTGKFVSIAYGESAYDAICWYGVQNSIEKPIDLFYAQIILFEKKD